MDIDLKKMRGETLNHSNKKYFSSCTQEVSGAPLYPLCIDNSPGLCRRGHEMTPENIYVHQGRPVCRKCQTLERKMRRHASGQSIRFSNCWGAAAELVDQQALPLSALSPEARRSVARAFTALCQALEAAHA